LRRDPECAMCWWGIALAAGPNINGPMSPEAGRQAYAAIREAQARASSATTVERALIAALAKRYAADPEADRAPLDSAFTRAMAEVARTYPSDADVFTLCVAPLMNLGPWNYWEGEYRNRKHRPGTERIFSTLECALAIAPDNPGACHYYFTRSRRRTRRRRCPFLHNAWSPFGLMKSLEAQGRKSEAAQVRARFREAWKHADVQLPASRF